ncbi:uncharacterized protein [Nicotiana tomentosiformis]|uniref:uncharacterized protein n=1 Tax=Nicotiana tomentosiformis TaxID=4098 RepID=UPI00388CBD4A
MVRTHTADVPNSGRVVPPVAAPAIPPADPVEDPAIEEEGEVPTAEPTLVDFMSALIYQSCVVIFCGYETKEDLILLDMTDFEVILSMDWLSPYYAILDCHANIVTLAIHKLPRFEWKGLFAGSQIISFMKARHMVEKGYLSYLAYVQDSTAESTVIHSVPVVWGFSDVFPFDIPGMPPNRDIYFCIDLAQGTKPISVPSYCMALKDLKEQLEMLLVKGFVRTSVSLWDTPVLFMKTKDGTMPMCIDYRELN